MYHFWQDHHGRPSEHHNYLGLPLCRVSLLGLPLCRPDLGHLTHVPCPSIEQQVEGLRKAISKYQHPAALYEKLGAVPCERLGDCF